MRRWKLCHLSQMSLSCEWTGGVVSNSPREMTSLWYEMGYYDRRKIRCFLIVRLWEGAMVNMKMKSASEETCRVWIRVAAGVFFVFFCFCIGSSRTSKTPRRLLLRPPRESPDCPLTWSNQPRIKIGLFYGCHQSNFFFFLTVSLIFWSGVV